VAKASSAGRSPPPSSWLDDEPPLLATGTSEFGRLWRRSVLRRSLVVVVTVMVAAAAAAVTARPSSVSTAEVLLRIAEGGVVGEVPLSARELRSKILDVAFSTPRLVALMRRLGIATTELDNDPQSAVVSFREGISVKVWQQIYLAGGFERPTRVTIGFKSSDRGKVAPVARGLAALLVDTEAKQRRADLEAHAKTASAAARQAAAEADQARRLEAKRPRAQAASGGPGAVPRSIVPAAETRLHDAQAAAVAADLRFRAAKESQDLRFEIVAEGDAPPPLPSFASVMTRNTAVAIMLSWPVWMLLFGAFDPRLTGADDAARMGFPVLGAIPGLPGAEAGKGVRQGTPGQRSHVQRSHV
jgi:hypothetical protein